MTHSLNQILELHDAILAKIEYRDQSIILHFNSVTVHQSQGKVGYDPGMSWQEELTLTVKRTPDPSLVVESLPKHVSDGTAIVNGEIFENSIPLNVQHLVSLTLELIFDDGSKLKISGVDPVFELRGQKKNFKEFK